MENDPSRDARDRANSALEQLRKVLANVEVQMKIIEYYNTIKYFAVRCKEEEKKNTDT